MSRSRHSSRPWRTSTESRAWASRIPFAAAKPAATSTSTTTTDDTSAAVSCGKTSTSFAVTAVFDGVGTTAAAAAAPAPRRRRRPRRQRLRRETNSADEQVQESGDAAQPGPGSGAMKIDRSLDPVRPPDPRPPRALLVHAPRARSGRTPRSCRPRSTTSRTRSRRRSSSRSPPRRRSRTTPRTTSSSSRSARPRPPTATPRSLLTQLSAQSKRSGTEFAALTVGGAEAAPAAAADQLDDHRPERRGGSADLRAPAEAASRRPPTEASAATLPIGATVGPAGLGVLPYSLQFTGDFFEIADLLERIDEQVGVAAKGTRGRRPPHDDQRLHDGAG